MHKRFFTLALWECVYPYLGGMALMVGYLWLHFKGVCNIDNKITIQYDKIGEGVLMYASVMSALVSVMLGAFASSTKEFLNEFRKGASFKRFRYFIMETIVLNLTMVLFALLAIAIDFEASTKALIVIAPLVFMFAMSLLSALRLAIIIHVIL